MSPDIQLQIAISFHHQGNIDAAKSLYKEVVKYDPKNDTALTNLGLIEVNSGNHVEALPLFKKLLELDTESQIANANIGICLSRLGDYIQAIHFFDFFLKKSPNNVQILTHQAICHSKTGNFQDALILFNTAISSEPYNSVIYTNAGILCNEHGQTDLAIQYLNQAIDLDGSNILARSQLATAFMDSMRYNEALAQCEKVLETHPNNEQALLNKGLTHYKLGQFEGAASIYAELLKINPKSAIGLINMTSIKMAQAVEAHQFDSAISFSLKAFRTINDYYYRDINTIKKTLLVHAYRIKHDLEQASFLYENGDQSQPILKFLDHNSLFFKNTEETDHQTMIRLDGSLLDTFCNYQLYDNRYQPQPIFQCLNPQIDWRAIEEKYFSSEHGAIYIDRFLSQEALKGFYNYALFAKVWNKEYKSCYLGAFGNQGFISPLHLQLAVELKKSMPRIYKDYLLSQMWGFKYDSQLGKGINVHADFAKINLNFWVSPDESNLDPMSGGLKVYKYPAPADWTFSDYNASPQQIYAFLEQRSLDLIQIPYRCNRAVLFNSALFHETDAINFQEGYNNRRINMTYLFGSQLA